jgi:hypothetical protein
MISTRSLSACRWFVTPIFAMLFVTAVAAVGQTESVIYNFPTDEQSRSTVCGPYGNLIADAAGDFTAQIRAAIPFRRLFMN